MAYNLNETFRSLCTEFETLVRSKYLIDTSTVSAFNYLASLEEFAEYSEILNTLREIRNALVHTDFNVDGNVGLVVTDDGINAIEEIIEKIKNPKLVSDVYSSNLKYCHLDDSVIDVLTMMAEYHYSHIPVLTSNNKIIGVFSENTIFSTLANNGSISLDGNTKIRDFYQYIPIDQHTAECFDFIGVNDKLYIAKDKFANPIINDKKLVALFVTIDGKSDRKILGILTPWDVIKREIERKN